ncbi:MAG: hypothetical protein R3244_12465 [Thermoanaerobaculia bacterium]|nr:hypothetical protein [Thermoanaerobaculia bacterium]
MIGETISHYRITDRLGGGGITAVCETEGNRFGWEVPLGGPADDPEVLERFQREALVASGFDDPRICTLHDAGQEGDKPFPERYREND